MGAEIRGAQSQALLVRAFVLTACQYPVELKSIIFWDMTPCSALSCIRRFGGTYGLHLQGRRIVQQTSEQAVGSLKMEAIRSSETSGTTQRTTRRHIPGDDNLHNHRCENLRSYIL
jgi:hypothetical protein